MGCVLGKLLQLTLSAGKAPGACRTGGVQGNLSWRVPLEWVGWGDPWKPATVAVIGPPSRSFWRLLLKLGG